MEGTSGIPQWSPPPRKRRVWLLALGGIVVAAVTTAFTNWLQGLLSGLGVAVEWAQQPWAFARAWTLGLLVAVILLGWRLIRRWAADRAVAAPIAEHFTRAIFHAGVWSWRFYTNEADT